MTWPVDEPVVCVVGPTASGKSALAQDIASALEAEVVSADSMQVYRGMDIGTGKVPASERRVLHHCIDLVEPGEPFSAAVYQRVSRSAFDDIRSRGKRIILCGGTGFYVRAAIDDYVFAAGEQVGNEVRDAYTSLAARIGPKALWERLRAVDPMSADQIEPNDVKRVVRAFELVAQGDSYAQRKSRLAFIPQRYPAVFIGIAHEAGALAQAIDQRVDDMMRAGLVAEVEGLVNHGFRQAVTAMQAIGYKEIIAFLEGERSLANAVADIKTATRRYAKRQRTWFRKDERIVWIDGSLSAGEVLERSLHAVEEASARASYERSCGNACASRAGEVR